MLLPCGTSADKNKNAKTDASCAIVMRCVMHTNSGDDSQLTNRTQTHILHSPKTHHVATWPHSFYFRFCPNGLQPNIVCWHLNERTERIRSNRNDLFISGLRMMRVSRPFDDDTLSRLCDANGSHMAMAGWIVIITIYSLWWSLLGNWNAFGKSAFGRCSSSASFAGWMMSNKTNERIPIYVWTIYAFELTNNQLRDVGMLAISILMNCWRLWKAKDHFLGDWSVSNYILMIRTRMTTTYVHVSSASTPTVQLPNRITRRQTTVRIDWEPSTDRREATKWQWRWSRGKRM